MGTNHDYGLQRPFSRWGKIRTRTWLMLGGATLAVLGLVVWAAFSLLSWLWAQTSQVTGTGWQLATDTLSRVEEVVPGLQEKAEKWWPGDAVGVAAVVPGLREEAEKWLPWGGDSVPEKDVSGVDPGPVERFPGLVRSQFSRDQTTIHATYVGHAEFDAVLAHYVEGFAAEGFAPEVLAADGAEEYHQFVNDRSGLVTLKVVRHPGGVVEVAVGQVLD
ncbi:MAG: hypothetical protein U9R22_08385 [Pseudomonadota bacterium]|nr:hypothetical protein [Pseudomonadota bacterium]